MSNLPCLVSRWRSCEDSKESLFPTSPNLLSAFILQVSSANAFLSMNTNYAPGWGFKITYPLFKYVSLNYWLRLLEKGQCFTSDKLHLQSTEASRTMRTMRTRTMRTTEYLRPAWSFPAAGTVPLQGRHEGAKASRPITEKKKRKKKSLKGMLFPLVDSGRGGICNHSFGGINPPIPAPVLPWRPLNWTSQYSLESPVQRRVMNHSAPQDTLPLSRRAPHYLKDAHGIMWPYPSQNEQSYYIIMNNSFI